MYANILVKRVRLVTVGWIGKEQKALISGEGCIGQIFTLEQMGEKMIKINYIMDFWLITPLQV